MKDCIYLLPVIPERTIERSEDFITTVFDGKEILTMINV